MMRVETYSRLGAIAGKYADEIVATSFENWPQAHVEHALARPATSIAVSTAELDQLLDGNETRRSAGRRRAGAMTIPSVLSSPRPATDAFFPKLGPVSWKEVASLRSIPAEDVEMLLPVMFASITSRMAIILDAFVVTGAPTFLHLFPHIELSHFIEARMTIDKRQVIAAKWQRLPLGGKPDERMKASLIDLASMLAQSASLPNMLIDLCLDTATPNAAPACSKSIRIFRSLEEEIDMPGRPVSLKGHMHVCPMVDPGPKPHIGGPVVSTAQNFVTVDGVPIATIGDKTLCSGVPTNAAISSGSVVANINGKKIARIGDSCEHGGLLTQGVLWITFE